MNFRFTLDNAIEGTQVINEPDGWKDIKIKLERDGEYHSLIEVIDTQFFAYNQNNIVDGGRIYLKNIEDTQGINAVVNILVELTEDGTTWDEVFTGNIDLSTIKDISRGDKFYRFGFTIIPNDLWATFMNRKSVVVNLQSPQDQDGQGVYVPVSNRLDLSTQLVRKKALYEAFQESDAEYSNMSIDYATPNIYHPLDLHKITLDEIDTKFTYSLGDDAGSDDPSVSPNADLELINCVEQGNYTFDIAIYLSSTYNAIAGFGNATWLVYLEKNYEAPILLTRTALGTGGVDGRDRHTYTGTINFGIGDRIKLYFKANTATPGTVYIISAGNAGVTLGASYISIIADTDFHHTTCDSLLVHEAADAIVRRMGGGFEIYSDYFGGTSLGYAVNGCGYRNAIMKGLHVRGYLFSERFFSMSMDQWWEGANPIFNLGLGPEAHSSASPSKQVIRIEQKDHFYDDNTIMDFDYVNDIERSYDMARIFKSINIGYATWSAESGSGIDDPQTQHTYSNVYKMIGQDFTISSSWVAASLAIEQTRRNRKQAGVDWRMDNDIMIINLDSTLGSALVNTYFTSITNLLNATTRYNVRFTVYRNFQRWIKFLSGCMQDYLTSKFRFQSGEGNYATVVGANTDICDTGTWTENQDISPVATPYTTAQMYTFKVPLEWSDYKLIRDNRHRGIGVSQTASDHKICHIKTLTYDIQHASAQVTGWIK